MQNFKLEDQIRIQGGNEYLEIINNILYQLNSPNLSLNNYEFKIFDEINEMKDLINKRNTSHGFSRLIAGYDWDWQSKDGSKGSINEAIDNTLSKLLFVLRCFQVSSSRIALIAC